ncbi:MAG: hypothetical protein P4L92_19630 [Rudaea sp.]|nr:hypothetical protein [Rudaea sp.]
MNRNNLTTAVIAAIAGVAGIANMASAVNLNPDGLGQVLLYPYYTVNGHQQTLLSVVNTDTVNGKAVKVRFLEGYNSREVLDFNLFLSPADVWTAALFALSDGGIGSPGTGDGGGIFTFDKTCTAPAFTTTGLSNGATYQAFLNYAYTGNDSDTGPVTNDRTREGHFEMISMADITGAPLLTDIKHVNGVPPKCGSAEADFEAGTTIAAPTGGLFGAASVVNVGQGTFYAYNADALDGFTAVTLATPTGFLTPTLGQVNDAGGTTATSFVFNDGKLLTSIYPLPAQGIDAVSSVFDAARIYNEYETSSDGSVGSDWVVTFPTKRFYVDAGTFTTLTAAIIPFEHLFGAKETGNGLGLSCTVVGITTYDREENTATATGCGFSPCPPGQPPSSLCHETNVVTFDLVGTGSVLDSNLTSNIKPIGTAGWANLDLTITGVVANPHNLRPSTNGNVFTGLPITGFEAVEFVNGNVGGVLSNYSGVYRHRQSRSCANGGGACS